MIEVADSSIKFDREIKLPLYAQASIQEYWLIDLNISQMEIYRFPKGMAYESRMTASLGDEINILASSKIFFPVTSILGTSS